jgi:hypothetical protein
VGAYVASHVLLPVTKEERMRSHNLLSTLAVISAAACSTDEPTAAVDHQLRPSFSSSQERVAICHQSGWALATSRSPSLRSRATSAMATT